MAEFKDASVLVESVQLKEILLCSVRECTAAILLRIAPAPARMGWALKRGWWLCPEHTEVDND
jgi:hypothetical protein